VSVDVDSKIIPTISSKVAGPLGAVHLPRLWSKLTLASKGLLPPDYDECGDGFDAMTISALGLKRDDVVNFIKTESPTYMAFETWVVHQAGGRIDPAVIEAHNHAILSYNHGEDTAASMRAASGVADPSLRDAASLNTLDDFDSLHAHVMAVSARR
jgi:hypothetical protein